MALPLSVRLVDVSPRDGLQNEPQTVGVETKVALIERLAAAGVATIEAGSFVSPKWVPQMADSGAVFNAIQRRPGVRYTALVPNAQGLAAAAASRVDEVAIFAAATEQFSKRNINCSIAESLERFAAVMALAKERSLPVRGYVSCVLGCPYEGTVDPRAVAQVAKALYGLGCYEISLGDTIGVGTPLEARRLIETVAQEVPIAHLAVHFHDTFGQALANLYAVLELGVQVIDAAVAGLGGCPYARGATGNVASEDVVYMLHGMNIETGIDLQRLAAAGSFISQALGRQTLSRAGRALLSKAE